MLRVFLPHPAPRGFRGPAAPAGRELDLHEPFLKVSVKEDAEGLGRETQTQLTPREPDHAAVLNLLETAVSTSF